MWILKKDFKRALEEVVVHGNLEVVKWLHVIATTTNWYRAISNASQKTKCTIAAMNGAAANGHLSVVEWLHDSIRQAYTTEAMDGAARNGHLDVVRWLHENCTEDCSEKAILRAASFRDGAVAISCLR
ncbi:hypothetical protein PHMEG_00023469 [Phytophthora megakarya]|uniref:Ankyrin repeat-containing domain n=1 Tax=Phytophthora megakarya TaxID=4795 RepID=A0A225VG96_9STRA|nr:hypothetical protein PHMEG_00023469 [Phytophthora megakarya]